MSHTRCCIHRELYPVLKQLDGLIGVWRHSKQTDKPALYVFVWGHCCAEGRKLCYDLPGQEPFSEPFQHIGPSHNASVQHVDSMHCLLTVQSSTQHSPVTKAVQAATAVAVGGIQNSNRVCQFPKYSIIEWFTQSSRFQSKLLCILSSFCRSAFHASSSQQMFH